MNCKTRERINTAFIVRNLVHMFKNFMPPPNFKSDFIGILELQYFILDSKWI